MYKYQQHHTFIVGNDNSFLFIRSRDEKSLLMFNLPSFTSWSNRAKCFFNFPISPGISIVTGTAKEEWRNTKAQILYHTGWYTIVWEKFSNFLWKPGATKIKHMRFSYHNSNFLWKPGATNLTTYNRVSF